MNFTCDRAALTEAVNVVQKAVASRSSLPVLEGILITASKDRLTLVGNDLEIGIEAVLSAEIIQEGSVVLNSNLFGTAVRKLTGETVSLSAASGNTVKIKCGNSEIRLNGIGAEEFPEIPRFEIEYDIILTQREFKSLVRHTIFAVGTSESKLILTGCLLEASGKNVSMVAVDGFRLALRRLVTETESVSAAGGTDSEDFRKLSSEGAAIVIPAKSLKELSNILGDTDDKIIIKCSKKNVRFEFDNVNFTSRLLEGDYIDYKKIIPSDFATKIKADLKPVAEAVDRASIIITSEVNKSPLTLQLENGCLKLFCETSAGKVDELVPVDMHGEGLTIGFNNRYLLEALKAAEGDEVILQFNDPVSPCLISPAEGDSFRFLVLPVRLSTV